MATVKRKKTDLENPEQGIVIQNIQVRPVVRQAQDIQNWRNALKAAEAINSIRVTLYDLYEEVMLDGTLKNLMAKRILGVTKTRLKFINKAGDEVPELMELVGKKAFRQLRKEIMLQKFWGISVIELMKEGDNFKIYSVPRKHIRTKPGLIVAEQYGQSGDAYRTPPFNKYIFEVGASDDLGLILQACQYVIYKRGAFGDWAHFAEIFGMPFREARYDGYNDVVRKQIENALENMGSAGYIILPKEAEFKLHEAGNAQANGELYNTLRKACNDEMAVLILGQTETTTSSASSGYAQSETHAGVEAGINHDDKEDELSILNEQVLPILKNLGYPVDGGSFLHEPLKEKVTLKDQVAIIDTVKNKIKSPVDDDYVYEITGIPKPKAYDQMKADMDAASEAVKENMKQPDGNKKKGKKAEAADDPEPKSKLSIGEQIRLAVADFFAPAPKS